MSLKLADLRANNQNVSVLKKSQGELATKADLRELEFRLDTRFERIDGELKLNGWMLGLLIAGVMSSGFQKENPQSGVAYRMRICCLFNSENRGCA